MKNILILIFGLTVLAGLYFLPNLLGLGPGPVCSGWWWKASYFNDYGIYQGHPLYWVMALVILGMAAAGLFSNLTRGRFKKNGSSYPGTKTGYLRERMVKNRPTRYSTKTQEGC